VDVRGVSGSKVELVCEVGDLRDPLEECEWYSPTQEKYEGQISSSRRRSNSKVSNNENVQVEIDDRRDECILTIKNVRKEHEGVWECVAYEGRDDEANRYAVIRVSDRAEPFQLLLDEDETTIDAERGDDFEIICPTNHKANTPQERPVCKFIDPSGKGWTIVDKYGAIYQYEKDGIEAAGDVDKGECGIKIRNIGFEKSGTWKCEVLRKQRPGSTVLGSEVTSSSIKVDVFRTSRLNDDELELQGYEEDDERVEIVMEVEVNQDKEKFTDFFWLVQKSIKIYENEEECLGSGRRKNCYFARRRKRIPGKITNGKIKKYEMILEIETLTREDLESKMFLIKDYREYNSKEDKFQVMVVPKSRRNRSLDYETSDDQENSNRLQRQRVNAGQGCLIRDEFVNVGDSVKYAEHCVELVCQKNGNVDVSSMRASDCRQRKSRNK